MAMAEYAWTSFNDNAKVFKFSSARTNDSGKFHPTEKPIELYKWLLTKYAKEKPKSYKAFQNLENSGVNKKLNKTKKEQNNKMQEIKSINKY